MPTAKPQRKMVEIDVDETSGVDWPAHLAPGWVVCKSATAQDVQALFGPGTTEGTPTMATTEAQATPTVEDLAKQLEEMKGNLEKAEADKAAAEARATELEKAAAAKDDAELTEEQKILKALPAEMRERFEAMEKSAEADRQALQKAIDDRLDEKARTEAAGMFKSLAVDTDAVGPQLRRLALVDADLHKSVVTALTAAEEQLKVAGVFKTAGQDGEPAEGKSAVFAKAKELQSADPTLSDSQAFAKAFEDPELRKAYYEAEQAGQ